MMKPAQLVEHLRKRLEEIRAINSPSLGKEGLLQSFYIEDLSASVRVIRGLLMQRPDTLTDFVIKELRELFPEASEISFAVGRISNELTAAGEPDQFGIMRVEDRFFNFRFKAEAFTIAGGPQTLAYFKEMAHLFAQQHRNEAASQIDQTVSITVPLSDINDSLLESLKQSERITILGRDIEEVVFGIETDEDIERALDHLRAIFITNGDETISLNEEARLFLEHQTEAVENRLFIVLNRANRYGPNAPAGASAIAGYNDRDLSRIYSEMLVDYINHLNTTENK